MVILYTFYTYSWFKHIQLYGFLHNLNLFLFCLPLHGDKTRMFVRKIFQTLTKIFSFFFELILMSIFHNWHNLQYIQICRHRFVNLCFTVFGKENSLKIHYCCCCCYGYGIQSSRTAIDTFVSKLELLNTYLGCNNNIGNK